MIRVQSAAARVLARNSAASIRWCHQIGDQGNRQGARSFRAQVGGGVILNRTGTSMAMLSTSAGGSSISTPDAAPDGNLWQHIQMAYKRALDSGSLLKTDSNDAFITDGGVEFVVRVAASLRDKPKPPSSGEKREWRNPFLPYEEALWVQHLSDTHTLLLNKFNVVPHHSLVVTRAFQEQTEALTEADLEAAWKVLQAMPEGGICYFNCGPHSGASQPHKHLQILPLPLSPGCDAATPFYQILERACSAATSTTESSDGPNVNVSTECNEGSERGINGSDGTSGHDGSCRPCISPVVEVRQLPFRSYAAKVPQPERVTSEDLARIADALLQAMQAGSSPAEGLSYNVILTRQHLHFIPRARESSGPVACNSLGFAGTLFVRSTEELEYTQSHGPKQILADVGLPW